MVIYVLSVVKCADQVKKIHKNDISQVDPINSISIQTMFVLFA